MDYYIIPEWMYVLSLVAIAVFVLGSIVSTSELIKNFVDKRKEEKAFFAAVECKDEDELIRMEALFPGKYTADALLMIDCACAGMLDGCRATENEYLSKIYDRMETELTEAQEKRLLERLTEARGVMGFISFMQDHGIDAYFTYLQNGEIFFEDKHNG